MHFEKRPIVGDGVHEIVHVVRLVGRGGHEPVERLVFAIDAVRDLAARRPVEVVAGKIAEQLANQLQALAIVGNREVRDAARLVVRLRAAELLLGHFLVRDRAQDVRAGDEHVARALDHDVEVGDRGRVDGAAGARPHDRGNLRDDARSERVPEEDVGVAAEREHALLDARATRVVEPDDRRAHLHRQIHDLDDLRGVGFRQRSAEDGEVLRERVDRPSLDAAGARDDPVAGHDLLLHPEVEAAVGDELVDLVEGAGVEQEIDPLARRELPDVVLPFQAIVAAAAFGAALEVGEMRERIHDLGGHAHGIPTRIAKLTKLAKDVSSWGRDGYALTPCAFSQSFRNFSSPMSVSGCLNSCSMTAAGHVQMSAPRRAASTMWIGPRVEATSTSVLKS